MTRPRSTPKGWLSLALESTTPTHHSFRSGLRSPRPTMPSADFCDAIRGPHGLLSPSKDTTQISRGKSHHLHRTPAGFTAWTLDGYGLRDLLLTRPVQAASYPIPVRRVAALLHASFRPHLTMTPLRFANTSPPSGCVGDLHPQVMKHARHTEEAGREARPGESLSVWSVFGARSSRQNKLQITNLQA